MYGTSNIIIIRIHYIFGLYRDVILIHFTFYIDILWKTIKSHLYKEIHTVKCIIYNIIPAICSIIGIYTIVRE